MIQLKDICDIYDCPHTTAKDEGKGYPLVRTPNVGKGRLLLNGIHRVSEDVYNSRNSRAIPEEGDLILAREAPVGNVSIIMQGQRVCLGQRVVLIKPKRELVDPHYLTYYLLSAEVQNRLKNHANGAVVAHLNVSDIRNLLVSLPELDEQIAIGKILRSIEDKIELNNRINHNLEEQAQALYKSYFVDFETFSGGKFVDSELGLIPEGWNCGLVSDLLSIKYGKDHKKLSDGDIPVYGSGGVMRYVDTKIYEGEAVLIPRKGTLNNVFYVNKAFWTVDTMFYATSKEANTCIYSYLFLTNKDLASMNAGSAVPSMTTDILNNMQIVIPPEEVLESFNNICFVLFMQMKQCAIENKHLCNLRDTLLPKLVSGELKIDDFTC